VLSFVGSPSTQRRRISYFHNFLPFNHYLKKYFKLVYGKRCGYGNFNHWYNVSPIAYTFGRGEFYEGDPRVGRQPMKWSAIAESLRNIDLND
jgi:hypothetical protein